MRGERIDHTLAPTALANEAWLRLFAGGEQRFESDAEFLAAATTTLRRILVEHGRRRRSLKRGGGRQRSEHEVDQLPGAVPDDRLLAIDDALQRLQELDPEKARLVELRFFAGLEVEEAARLLGRSPRSAARDWRLARAFLRTQLGGGEHDGLDP